VWNYEGGVKTRIKGVQWNSAVFYIDWQAPQTRVALPTCGTAYVINAGHAVSKGFESSVQARVLQNLTLTGQVSYADSEYTQTVGVKTATANPLFVLKGDKLPSPPWSFAVSAQYDFELFKTRHSYVRFDYQYSSKFQQGPGPGTTSYTPDTFMLGDVHLGAVRLGVDFDGTEVSLFSSNVFASKDILALQGGRQSCPDAACTAPRSNIPNFTGSTLRPREVGLTVTKRF
jgi:outer membrane receptor protein involved in Fe transport